MKFHEKSLELNITRELLNLSDSWAWFLTDIPLWRYWRPRYRLPFLKFPQSTAGGFHITDEGTSDPTGEAGGGYDVRIRAGNGGHLLFIQYKKGDLLKRSPGAGSIFDIAPSEHFKFKINSSSTNQHFLLRELADGVGKEKGNAVVYAFPLIKDMEELEKNAGSLIRKTKFVSVADVDQQAFINNIVFKKGDEHSFRICTKDMNRCEVNYLFFLFDGVDRGPQIISDVIATGFQRRLLTFIDQLQDNYKKYDLFEGYLPEGLQRAFGQYLRYLLHYFEVHPSSLKGVSQDLFSEFGSYDFREEEFSEYKNAERDIKVVNSSFKALDTFKGFIRQPINLESSKFQLKTDIPRFEPSFLILPDRETGVKLHLSGEFAKEDVENISYLLI